MAPSSKNISLNDLAIAIKYPKSFDLSSSDYLKFKGYKYHQVFIDENIPLKKLKTRFEMIVEKQ